MRFADYLDQIRPVAAEISDTVLAFESLESTNGYARHLLAALPEDARPSSFVLLAFEQTAGRGRRDRRWAGPAGGLYVSWVLPLGEETPRAALPVLAAGAICTALRGAGAGSCQVKWPNDLMVDGRKLGGILIEVASPAPGARPMVIIGCGVNVHTDPSEAAGVGAATLAAARGQPIDFGELLVGLSSDLRQALRRSRETGWTIDRYRDVLVHRPGDRIRCRVGEREVEGAFVDLDPTGGLRLEVDGREELVSAGEVVAS